MSLRSAVPWKQPASSSSTRTAVVPASAFISLQKKSLENERIERLSRKSSRQQIVLGRFWVERPNPSWAHILWREPSIIGSPASNSSIARICLSAGFTVEIEGRYHKLELLHHDDGFKVRIYDRTNILR